MSAHPLSRRKFLGLSAAAAGSMLLAACGSNAPAVPSAPANSSSSSGSAPTPAAQAAAPQASNAKVELQVYVHNNHPFDGVKPLFEAKYPNVTLKMLGSNDMKAFRATLAAGGEGTPDLVWPEADAIQELGRAGALLDVTDIVNNNKDKLAKGKLTDCLIVSTGKYVAFPGDIAQVGLYYREDLLNKAGVKVPDDWTWDEFIDTSIKIKKDTGTSTLFFPSDASFVATTWGYIMMQLGGAITNVDGTQVTLDNDKGIAAMKLVKKMWDAKIGHDDGPFNETSFAAMAGNKISMMPMPVWYRGFAMEPNIKTPDQGQGQWRVALLPKPAANAVRTANFGGASVISTKYTKHPQEVKNFMEFALATMDGVGACVKYGIAPPYLPYLESKDWKDMRSPIHGDFAFNNVWGEAIKQYPGTWYKHPVFTEANNEINAQALPMLKGEVAIEVGMKAIGDRVRELNKRYQG